MSSVKNFGTFGTELMNRASIIYLHNDVPLARFGIWGSVGLRPAADRTR